ncbi:MAG TPA: response regulator [Kofleriaceae bacterium]|nr:response regulator [Kofleriaceae bacterium]
MSTAPDPTILIVEDDVDVREAYHDVLDQAGYHVITAANGKLALDWLRHTDEHPSMIVLDLMMPVMDGWQFRQEMRKDEALREIPVVVVTAHREDPGIDCVARLVKPVPLAELLSAVARVCGSPRAA